VSANAARKLKIISRQNLWNHQARPASARPAAQRLGSTSRRS